MTILQLNTGEYLSSRRRGGPSVFTARPARGGTVPRRGVIAEKRRPLRFFSREGIRGDVLTTILVLVLILCLCVLAADISALYSGGIRVGRLSAGVASLEQDNGQLQEQISRVQANLLTYRQNRETEPERVVVVSPAPLP